MALERELLPSALCEVSIGDVFTWSSLDKDSRIISVSVQLGVDENSSSCEINLYDRNNEIANQLIQMSFDEGGIRGTGQSDATTTGTDGTTDEDVSTI